MIAEPERVKMHAMPAAGMRSVKYLIITRRSKMKKMVCATRFMAIIVAVALVAVPALASTEFAANSETDFHALSTVATDEQTPVALSDSQLAQVEGQGPLLEALVGGILVGQAFIDLPGNFWSGLGYFLQVGSAITIVACSPNC
jgi:hypothetical protein